MISDIVIYSGLTVAALGILLLLRCIGKARRLQRGGYADGTLEREMKKLMLQNGIAVGIGFFGVAIMSLGFLF